jgi:hypothetical protein
VTGTLDRSSRLQGFHGDALDFAQVAPWSGTVYVEFVIDALEMAI